LIYPFEWVNRCIPFITSTPENKNMDKLNNIGHLQGCILGIHESAYEDILGCIEEDRLQDMIIIVDLRHHSYLYQSSNQSQFAADSYQSTHHQMSKYMGIPILDPVPLQYRDNLRPRNLSKKLTEEIKESNMNIKDTFEIISFE